MLDFPSLDPWMHQELHISSAKSYRHSVFSEQPQYRSAQLQRLKDFAYQAHDDARRKLRKLAGISLDPFGSHVEQDPAKGYPGVLHKQTLQGYFGELLAGIFVETCSPDGLGGWRVPAFMFTSHGLAFDKLELWHQNPGALPGIIPGQHGNDCLGFLLDDEGHIIKCVVCESKCTLDHRPDLIAGAHGTFQNEQLPVSLWQLIAILETREDDESHLWVERLRALRWGSLPHGYERYDLVMYVCGRSPVRNESWLNQAAPHSSYLPRRRLHAVEVHISDLRDVISYIYETDQYARN